MAEPPRSPPPFLRTPAFWVTVAALLIANWVLGSLFLAPPSRLQVPYTEFQSQLTAGNVESVTSKGETIEGEFHKAVTYPKGSADRSTLFQTQRPSYAKDDLLKALEAEHVTVNAKPLTTAPSLLTELLVGFKPTLLLIGGFLWLARRATSGLSSMGGFGRSRAKRYDASALLRPGRFDRRVTVNPPDLSGRAAILSVHARGVPLAPGVDLTALAAQTPGMVGADLRNLVNEAALLSARRRREGVHAADFTDALERLMLGTASGSSCRPANASATPTTSRAMRSRGCFNRVRTRSARCRSCLGGAPSASRSRARTPTATRTRSPICGAGSSARSVGAPPSSSCTDR
jgi:ATP-dependent Zn protease